METANDNYRAKGAGESYYPEMGERHDGKALFESQIGYKGYYLKWAAHRHEEALALLKRLRIRPRYMSHQQSIKGRMYWSCGITWAAGDKIRPYAVHELLLD